jgi:mRNA interferase MazF
MAKPKRGEVWLVDMGYAAKVRSALVLRGPVLDEERALTTVIPHTTSVRGTRFEIPTSVGWLKNAAFDVQGVGTYPTVKLMRKLGDFLEELLGLVESRVVMLLALPGHP